MFDIPGFLELNIGVALPAITLAMGTLVLLLVDIFLPEERKHWTPILALSGISASFVMTLFTYSPERTEAFSGMFIGDAFTGFANITVLITAFLSILLSTDYLKRTHIAHGEYYSLILLSTSGVMFMAGANDLVMAFVGLELLSIPLYVLAAFRGIDRKVYVDQGFRSEESGMKYFILGAFASAFFVYGAALIYGATGTTRLPEIYEAMAPMVEAGGTGVFLMLIGVALVIVALGFKVAAVPFHMWTPDVYEGSPTPVTAFMSVAAKVGGFAALLRIMIVGISGFVLVEGDPATWQNVMALIAAATLILGNVVALSQSNIKRLLAYSSIAHAGYILMAVAAAGTAGVGNAAAQGAMLYMLAYLFANIGAFAVVLAVEKDDGTGLDMDNMVGLGKSRPWLAAAMAIFMLSLTGIPPTAGFLGKWFVFSATVDAGLYWLAILGVLTSVVGAYYYVRVIVNMYLREDREGDAAVGATAPVNWTVYASMTATLVIGILAPLAANLVSMIDVAPMP